MINHRPPVLITLILIAAAAGLLSGTTRRTEATATTGDAPVVMAAGDISSAGTGDNSTASLLTAADHVVTLGDNAYASGTLPEYLQRYDPSWGVAAKTRTRPSVGNHEYRTPDAQGYRDYFAVTGDTYYSWVSPLTDAWLMVAWDSNCGKLPKGSSWNGCAPGSPQHTWLRDLLASNSRPCVLMYSHHPRWSVGKHAPGVASAKHLWNLATKYKVDLLLNGHDHNYQRWTKLAADGSPSTTGTRQVINGEGGSTHYEVSSSHPYVEAAQSGTYGVVALTLHPDRYDGRFIPVAGQLYEDTFTGTCN